MIANKTDERNAAAPGAEVQPPASPDVVRVRNVSFAYDDGLTVLDDLTMSVRPGEFVAIVGPNGAGKSTLLKIILGLLPPQRGRVDLFGEELSRFRDWWRIGYVAQRPEQSNPHFPATVEEVVLLGRVAKMGLFRWPRRADRAAARRALELVGMEPLRHKMIGQLSGGQLQRVFIARALAAEPELLILDEPTAGVDAESQARFYSLLKDLNDELGVALLFVSHDIGPLREMLDTVACVNRTLCYYGPPEGFGAAPEHFAVHLEHGHTGGGHGPHEQVGDHV
jgi:zinc transport system ATP-binding protein